MKKDRDTKELKISDEPKKTSKTKNEVKKTDTKIEDELKDSIKNNDVNKKNDSPSKDHSFYKEKEKKGWKRGRKFWIITISIILIIGLAVGLGVGLGVDWGGSSDSMSFSPSDEDQDGIDDWLEDKINSVDVERERATDAAIQYTFDYLHDLGVINETDYSRWTKNADEDANNTIRQEKDQYKADYGDNWKEQWDDYLISLGFDNEDEYEQNLISQDLSPRIINFYTDNNDSIIKTTDANYGKYISTITTIGSNPRYNALSNEYGHNQVDVETAYELYLRSTKPIATFSDSVTWAYTDATGLYNGYYGTDISFTDRSNIEAAFNLFRLIHDQDSEGVIEDEMEQSTDGIKRLSSASADANVIVSYNILTTLFTNAIPTVDTSGGAVIDFGADLHDSIFNAAANEPGWDWPIAIEDVRSDDFNSFDEGVDNSKTRLGEVGNNFLAEIKDEMFRTTSGSTPPVVIPPTQKIFDRPLSRTITIDGAQGTPNQYLLSFTSEGLTLTNIHNEGLLDYNGATTQDDLYDLAVQYTVSDLNRHTNDDDPSVENTPSYNILGDFDSWIDTNGNTIMLNFAMQDQDFIYDNITGPNATNPYNVTPSEIIKDMYLDIYNTYLNYVTGVASEIEDFSNDNDTVFDDQINFSQLQTDFIDDLIYFSMNIYEEGTYVAYPIDTIIANNGDLGGTNN